LFEEKPMPYQNIDASLSPADAKAVKDDFDAVLKKLPFLINLTPQERKAAPSRPDPTASPSCKMPSPPPRITSRIT